MVASALSMCGRCERCPELRISDGGLIGALALPPPERYPLAGENVSRRTLSFDSAGNLSPDAGDRRSGEWGQRIPTGVFARDEDGSVAVVPARVHKRLHVTRSMVLPPDLMAKAPAGKAPRECGICFGDDLDDTVAFECKQHYYCTACVTRHLQECLARAVLPTCPASGCTSEPGPGLCQDLLGPREFEQYLLASLRATKRCQTCPWKGCGAAVYIEEAVARGSAQVGKVQKDKKFEPGLSTSVRCPQCEKSFCMVCFQTAHPKYTCEQAKRRARHKGGVGDIFKADLAPGMVVKPCPRCGNGILKSNEDDCDHMTCSRCNKEFCWTCFADRQVIYHHGNHYHLPSCRFFASYDGPLEHLPAKCTACKEQGRACRPPKA